MNEPKSLFWALFYSSENCHLSGILKWIGGLFDTPYQRVHAPKISLLLNIILYKVAALCDVCSFVLLPDLLKIGFTITEIDLFCCKEHRKRKYADFRLSMTKWRCVLNRGTNLAKMWKHFNYWPSSSNPSLNHWSYFQKDC